MQTRVLQLKLRRLNRGKAQRLEAMQHAFTEVVRLHLNAAYALPKPSVSSLHAACYQDARARFALPASVIQQARDKALAIYRRIQTRPRRERKTARPRLVRPLSLRLAAENLRLFAAQDVVRITTSDGFLWLPLRIPAAWRALCALPHAVSALVRRGTDWYLMLAVKSEEVPALEGPHFGLDLGVANMAVLAGPGVVQFWDGKPLRYMRARLLRYRQALRHKRKLGMVKRSTGKEARWATQRNHQVSREIIDLVAAHGGVLHVEKLLGIRDRVKMTRRVNRMVQSWPFAQLLDFLTYKAALVGVRVVEEDPRHTSQRCASCGHTDRKNRPAPAAFRCVACGYTIHADLNAARNLAARGAGSSGMGAVTAP